MRALHTADWHIGQPLNGWSREAEHEAFLAALAEEQIDLLLVAGDVFDNTNPSGETQRLFYRAMARFKKRRPGLRIIITGGNHDPALRIEAPGDLLGEFDIHAVGMLHRSDGVPDLDVRLIPVPGPDGAIGSYVPAVDAARRPATVWAARPGLPRSRNRGQSALVYSHILNDQPRRQQCLWQSTSTHPSLPSPRSARLSSSRSAAPNMRQSPDSVLVDTKGRISTGPGMG